MERETKENDDKAKRETNVIIDRLPNNVKILRESQIRS